MFKFVEEILKNSFQILNSASVWLVFSFILAGVLRNILNPLKFQRVLGNTKISSIFKSTLSRMLLPICSCGVIPLGLSMYFSGAYLGPTLAFMTSAPMINPIAILLTFGLLGKKIALIYTITGFCLPFIIGLIGNKLGKDEIHAPGVAIIFLMAGTATNLPELISMYKLMGKRTVAIYSLTVISPSLLVGYLTCGFK